jgi:hypothetical protein
MEQKPLGVAFALQGTPNFVRDLHLIVFTASSANSLVESHCQRKSEFEAIHMASAICVRFASRIFEGSRKVGLLIQSLILIEYSPEKIALCHWLSKMSPLAEKELEQKELHFRSRVREHNESGSIIIKVAIRTFKSR